MKKMFENSIVPSHTVSLAPGAQNFDSLPHMLSNTSFPLASHGPYCFREIVSQPVGASIGSPLLSGQYYCGMVHHFVGQSSLLKLKSTLLEYLSLQLWL